MPRRGRGARWRDRLKGLAVALLPASLATIVVGVATAIRVETPVRLEVVVDAAAMTVAGDKRLPLPNDSTPFRRLIVNACDAVSFPSLQIEMADETSTTSAVNFRCDPYVPGSRVRIQPAAQVTESAQSTLGSLDRITVQRGDRVSIEKTDQSPLQIRLEVSRNVPWDFSLANVPFEIVAEFARPEGLPTSVDSDGVRTYRARFASDIRSVHVTPAVSVNVVVEPAVAEVFRGNVEIPVELISLDQKSDVDDTFRSTVIDGTLKYVGAPDTVDVPLRKGDAVTLRGTDGRLHLMHLGVDRERAGLGLAFEGQAVEVSVRGVDRRLTLFDRVVSDRNRALLAVVVAVAAQLAWLRKNWSPARRSRAE